MGKIRKAGPALAAIAAIAIQLGGPTATTAQKSDHFVRFTIADGLSHGTVRALAQDAQGFLWVGTLDGLNRYDGHEFDIYRHDSSDPDSLPASDVYSLLVDADDRIWAGTSNGIGRLGEERASTKRYMFSDEGKPIGWVTALCLEADGTLWAGTTSGLLKLDERSDSFEEASFLGKANIVAIGCGAPGETWIITRVTALVPKLWRLDREDGTAREVLPPPGWQIYDRVWADVEVSTLIVDYDDGGVPKKLFKSMSIELRRNGATIANGTAKLKAADGGATIEFNDLEAASGDELEAILTFKGGAIRDAFVVVTTITKLATG